MWTGISPTSGDGGYEKNLGREREEKREPENVTSTRNLILSNRLYAFAHVSYLGIAIYLAHTTHFVFTTQPNTLKGLGMGALVSQVPGMFYSQQ